MSKSRIKELLVYKKDVLLKSSSQDHLEEHEYLFTQTLYNEKEQVISEKHFDAEGNVSQEYHFLYDDAGFLREEMLKEDDGFIAEHKTYEPDDKGNISKEFRHYMDGSFDTITYTYNDKGLLSMKETMDPDEEIENIEEFQYQDGVLTYYVLRDADNDIIAEKKISYDEKGNPLEITDFDGMENLSVRKVIEYNPSGSKKETLTYNNDQLVEKVVMTEDDKGQLVQVVEETKHKKNTVLFEYDQEGNIVLQEEHDRNGEVISKVKRTFNPNNQMQTSNVFIHGGGRGLSKNYTLRHEYVLFEDV